MTRLSGAEPDWSKADAEDELEPGRDAIDAEAKEAAVLFLFLLATAAAVSALILLPGPPSSGTKGTPADLNCGYAESWENHGNSSSSSPIPSCVSPEMLVGSSVKSLPLMLLSEEDVSARVLAVSRKLRPF